MGNAANQQGFRSPTLDHAGGDSGMPQPMGSIVDIDIQQVSNVQDADLAESFGGGGIDGWCLVNRTAFQQEILRFTGRVRNRLRL